MLSERLPARDQGMIYRAVEKIDSTDRRYYLAVRERLEQGKSNSKVFVVFDIISLCGNDLNRVSQTLKFF